MPTTSADAALRALRGLHEVGVQYAVLHAVDKLQDGNISDVDIVVADPPTRIIQMARHAWFGSGLSAILVWPYDIGGTLSVFLASANGQEGVQLDMLFDPKGVGTYGVRSGPLVESAAGGPLPVVSDAARLTYLWRKRVVKGHDHVLGDLRSEASGIPADDLMKASTELTGSTETAGSLLSETHRYSATSGRSRHPLAHSRRYVDRFLSPIGFWVHATDRSVAEELAKRLSGYLVLVETSATPPPFKQFWWYITNVRPTTLRPGAYISHGARPTRSPAPSLVLVGQDADEEAPKLIAEMADRITQ